LSISSQLDATKQRRELLDSMSKQQVLTDLQKKQLCLAKKKDHKLTSNDLIALAKKLFALEPSTSQITRMLAKKDEYMAISEKGNAKGRKRMREAKFDKIETPVRDQCSRLYSINPIRDQCSRLSSKRLMPLSD
jgi:hypothetical protein